MNGNLPKYTHLVALPYPGRGHINPMMNLCKLLVSKHTNLVITFIITEEWLSFIESTPKPDSIIFRTIPNVIPSELIRASIFPEFVKAVFTKMESPVDELLKGLEEEEVVPPLLTIIADTYVPWAVELGRRRNIPVVSFWTMSPSVYTQFYHFDLVVKSGHYPVDLSERGNEIVDYIPGVGSTRVADLPAVFSGVGKQVLDDVLFVLSCSKKAQSVMFSSFEELELEVITSLKKLLPVPVYSVGPLVPHTTLDSTANGTLHDYFEWLESQPEKSVLYISLGSFLSASREQLEEIIQGVRESGVRFLWIARGDTLRIQEDCSERGLVVPWCDQLRVLCHSSIGGFWTHCGWNSTLEGVYAGVPMLTFPIFFDQVPDQKLIADNWRIGMRVKEFGLDVLVGRKEISKIVQRFMDLDRNESKEMRRNSSKLKERCRQAFAQGGSSETNSTLFLRDFCR